MENQINYYEYNKNTLEFIMYITKGVIGKVMTDNNENVLTKLNDNIVDELITKVICNKIKEGK